MVNKVDKINTIDIRNEEECITNIVFADKPTADDYPSCYCISSEPGMDCVRLITGETETEIEVFKTDIPFLIKALWKSTEIWPD